MSRPPTEPLASHPQFVVDAMVLAHGQLTWEREFSDIRFERLADVALSVTPEVAISLKFGMLAQRPVIHGELRAGIKLLCQRCLKPMQYRAAESFDLMLIEQEAELELVPESHEPWVVNPMRLNVQELVEEQLLLALPLIARHADESECLIDAAAPLSKPDVQAERPVKEVQRPFGQLRDLLGKSP